MSRLVALLLLLVALTGCSGCSHGIVWSFSSGSQEDPRSPFERAAQEGDVAEVKASRADPNDKGGTFGSPLHAASFRDGNVEVIRVLLSAGANPDGPGHEGGRYWTSPLWHAATNGDVESTRALLDAGASIEQKEGSGLTPGWLKPPVLDLLIERGLDLMAVDEKGRNQLHIALAPPVAPQPEGIEYLVRAGLPINARDRSDKTPLAYWREPRDYEVHWFQTWLLERLSSELMFERQRENRAKISALLERAGASL